MTRTVAQHWRGTKAAAVIAGLELVGASPFVSLSEAERRAEVCSACEKNSMEEVGSLEEAEDKIIASRLDGRTTRFDQKLGHCSVCTCRTSTIVHMKPVILKTGVTPEEILQYPQHCWKHNFL